LQWPTLPTLIMFPILVFMYLRLARREEREALSAFGEAYARYAERTPAFFPRFSGPDATGEGAAPAEPGDDLHPPFSREKETRI